MSATRTENLGLPWLLTDNNPRAVVNEILRFVDTALQGAVKDKDLTSPPGSPADGDRYIVGASATGAWSGFDDYVVMYRAGLWYAYAPVEGWRFWVDDEDAYYEYDGVAWSRTYYMRASSSPAISSGVLALDLSAVVDFDVAWDEDITSITISGWPASGRRLSFFLRLAMDSTSRTVAWPAGWLWPSGSAPSPPSTDEDLEVEVWSRDGGSTIYAREIGRAFS